MGGPEHAPCPRTDGWGVHPAPDSSGDPDHTAPFLVVAGPRSSRVVESWGGRPEAELMLRPGAPEVPTSIGAWSGWASGVDLASLETTIRAAGGEPLRIVERSP